MENVAAANCPEIKGRRLVPEARSGPADLSEEEAWGASDPLPPSLLQNPPPSVTAPACPIQPPDPTAAPQPVQACGAGAARANVLIQVKSGEDPAEGPPPAEGPAGVPSLSGPSPDSPTSPLTLDLSRTFSRCSAGPGPVSEPHPNSGSAWALTAGSPGCPPPDSAPSDHGPGLDLATLSPGQASILGSSASPAIRTLPPAPEETSSAALPSPGLVSEPLAQDPDPAGLHVGGVPSPQTSLDSSGKAAVTPEPALTSPSSSWYQSPDLASDSLVVPEAPNPGPCPGLASCPNLPAAKWGPSPLKSQACLMVPPAPNVQQGCSPGPQGGSLPVVDSGPAGAVLESRPAITIEADSAAAFSPPSPPALTSSSLPATILLLDPFSVPHQASKGGSSSGHASSLSPSPRNTQSPPKQTLFSPCVDVFEPEPLSWEDGEEEQEEEENEDEEEDVGADESQYRHRRLTGDSGIEVCRCRVDEEGEGEELGRKECNRRGVHGEGDRKGRANTRLHDSVDCPARRQTAEGHTPTRPPTSEGADKAVVMETV